MYISAVRQPRWVKNSAYARGIKFFDCGPPKYGCGFWKKNTKTCVALKAFEPFIKVWDLWQIWQGFSWSDELSATEAYFKYSYRANFFLDFEKWKTCPQKFNFGGLNVFCFFSKSKKICHFLIFNTGLILSTFPFF